MNLDGLKNYKKLLVKIKVFQIYINMQKRRSGFHQYVRAYNYTPYQRILAFNINTNYTGPTNSNIYNYNNITTLNTNSNLVKMNTGLNTNK
jgi:hypothetical protein